MVMQLEPGCLILSEQRQGPVRVEFGAVSALPWDDAIAAARAVLSERARRGGTLDILLSESYYRLGLIKTSVEALDATELETLARHHFRAVLGELCASCEFRVVPVPASAGMTGLLCCAIDREGIEGFHRVAEASGCVIGSLAPRIAMLEAGLAAELVDFSGHLVLADREAAAIVALRAGAWTQVMTRRHGLATDWLAQALGQAESLAGTGTRMAWLAGNVAATDVDGWQLRRLHQFDHRARELGR